MIPVPLFRSSALPLVRPWAIRADAPSALCPAGLGPARGCADVRPATARRPVDRLPPRVLLHQDSDLPSLLQASFGTSYFYLMEFDWAIRADNTIVAVVTPAGTATQKQFGCVILNFTLQSGTTSPFGSFWATVTDTDPSGPNGTSETDGSNGCTYEPRSNNGVVIVRYLTNSSSPSIQTYSLVNTGLIP